MSPIFYNFAVHRSVSAMREFEMSNLNAIFLPPNSFLFSPMDEGIIAALKCCYRLLQIGRCLDLEDIARDDISKVGILQPVRWICAEWIALLTRTSSNYWLHTKLCQFPSLYEPSAYCPDN